MSRIQSWLPKSWLPKTRKPITYAKRRTGLLQVMNLEDRITPANFDVTNLLDSGAGSLRQAVLDANANVDADTITITVAGTVTLGSTIAISNPVDITANLPGVIISGGGSVRVFETTAAAAATAISFNKLTIANGSAASGAGIFANDESITLNSVTVRNNTATSTDGGGIFFNSTGSLTVNNSTFHDNKAAYGGAIDFFSTGGSLTLNNATITGNTATNNGGGIYFVGSTSGSGAVIRNSTIVGNSSPNGGGIFHSSALPLTIDGSIVSGNTATTGPDISTNGTATVNFSALGSTVGIVTLVGANNLVGADLKLGALANNGGIVQTILPAVDSPVRDVGSNVGGLLSDANAGFRVFNGQADIGAVELAPVDFIVKNANDSGPDSLRARIVDANQTPGTQSITFNSFFNSAQTIKLASEILISDSVNLTGPSPLNTHISGNNVTRIFNVNGPGTLDVTINRVFLENGNAGGGDGGAILNTGENVSILNSQVVSNSASRGGAFAFSGSGGSLTVLNSTFTGNKATSDGGAILAASNQVSITDSTVTNNSAGQEGGAIFFASTSTGKLTLQDTKVTGNTAGTDGGGIYFFSGGNLEFTDSTISNNKATGGTGGGLYFFGTVGSGGFNINSTTISGNSASSNGGGVFFQSVAGTTTITDSTIAGNTGLNGGGIRFDQSSSATLNLTNSTLNDNSANGTPASSQGNGGGLFNNDGTVNVSNSTFSNNRANRQGGGIQANGGTTTIRNATITDNTARADNGALGSGGGIERVGAVHLFNTIVAGNFVTTGGSPNEISGVVDMAKNNLIGDAATAGGIVNGLNGNITGKAIGTILNTTLAINGGPTLTHALVTGSFALDKASSAELGGATTDQRGRDRTNGTAPDIGAYEAQFVVTNTIDSGNGSLREAVAEANRIAGANTITFDPAVFGGVKTITLSSGELFLNESVTIQGPGPILLTISGNTTNRIFNTTAGSITDTFTINNLTLANGSSSGAGGAILADNEIVDINNSVITSSKSDNNSLGGGGIRIGAGSLTLTNVTVSNNSAADVGGVSSAGTLNVVNSTISNNTSSAGGAGIGNVGGTLFVTGSTISNNIGNALSGNGGGIFNSGNATITNSTISGNSAHEGAGIYSGFGSGSSLTIRNSTITGNSGVRGAGVLRNISTPIIESSIIAGNIGTNGPDISAGVTINFSKSAIGNASGFTFGSGTGNLTPGTDLKLGALAKNGGGSGTLTHLPAIDSPLRGKGSNTGALTTDQRGFPRTDGVGNIDIGAVQVQTTSIVSITRNNANPTAAASVSWGVTLADSLTGVSASNFSLSGSGAAGASITSVTGSGSSYTVTAATGSDGDLTLNFDNSLGLSRLPGNLPLAGESYAVNKVAPTVSSITLAGSVSPGNLLTDVNVGPGSFSVVANYSEPMNTAINPVVDFPVESPAGSLSFVTSFWQDPATFVSVYNVNDLNLDIADIDVRVTGGEDVGGSPAPAKTTADLFSIDTRNPFAVSILRNAASPTNAATVSWTVNFSEAVTGLGKDNFSLFNGGLTGSPAITAFSGSGSTYTVTASTGTGEGNLALVVDNGANTIDINGNLLANTPISGGDYAVDHVSPAANQLNLNTLLVSDADVGPNGFTISLKYNEIMDTAVNPTVSFPVEFPASLTFNGGVWLDARTYQAKYDVADLGVEQDNIDVRITGGQDVVGNTQTQFDAVDVFSIDTQNAVIGSITSTTPDGTYGFGDPIDITLNFSEPVNLVGTLNVTLDTGAVVSIVGPQSGASLSGTYTVGSGDNSADLNVNAIALTGGSTLRDDATNNSVLTLPASNLAVNSDIVVSTGAAVSSVVVNSAAVQRSRLTTIAVNLSAPVDAATIGAITLTRTQATASGTVGTVVTTGSGLIVSPVSGLTSVLTLAFENITNAGVEFGSLADGRWQLAIPSLGFTSTEGDTNLRRLFGDINNDGTVSGNPDFAAFGSVFGTTLIGSPFDFNNDGTIDGSTDFAAFGSRFGVTL